MNAKMKIYLLVMAAGLIWVACRKMDKEEKIFQQTDLRNDFFNKRPAEHPLIAAMQGFMKRKNEQTPIIENIAKMYGIPYWDKALLYTKPAKNTLTETLGDTSYVAYIPLVPLNQNIVNGQLTIVATPEDTTFSVLLASQYDQYGFSPNADSLLNGLKIFSLFAQHERNVFGHTAFNITDNRILKGQTSVAIDSTKQYQIRIDSIVQNLGEAMAAPPEPLPNSSCMSVYEMIDAGYIVNYYMVGSTCVITSYTLPGTELSPNGGGGGGSGGGTGWTPGGGTNQPPEETNDSLLFKAATLANKYRDSLSSLCESQHKERFFNIVNYNNEYDTFRVLTGPTDDEVKPNYNMQGGRLLKGSWHYHPKYSDGTPGSWPSGGDVSQLYDKAQGFVMIIDTETERYALVVENKTKMGVWEKIMGNGSAIFPYRLRDSVLADPRVWTTGSSYVLMTKEKLLQALGSSSASGIGLFQASSSNGVSFIKVN